jgi:hypothetical protein
MSLYMVFEITEMRALLEKVSHGKEEAVVLVLR